MCRYQSPKTKEKKRKKKRESRDNLESQRNPGS